MMKYYPVNCFIMISMIMINSSSIMAYTLLTSTTSRRAASTTIATTTISNAFVPYEYRQRVINPSMMLHMAQAQPEVQIKTKVTTTTIEKQAQKSKQKSKTDEPEYKRKEEFQDAPMYKLMLLSDNGYDSEHVITQLCYIMDDIDEDQAKTILEQAQMSGKGMCGIYPFEIAELYKEQLIRSDPMIYADLIEENA